MPDPDRTARSMLVLTIAAAVAAGLSGCGESHSEGDGHDHGAAQTESAHSHEGEAGHEHADDHADEAESHGEGRSLGSVEVAGATFEVTLYGAAAPNAELHLDVRRTAGPAPSVVRVWIGDEAGTGALRAKLDSEGDDLHGHVEAPADLAGATLWLEVEAADGAKSAASLPL